MKTSFFCAAASIALFANATAAAQGQNPIDYCRENSDGKKARIACLEAAITTLMSGQTASAATETAPLAAAPPEVTDPDAPTGLGAEQVERRRIETGEVEREKVEKERVYAKITDFAKTGSGFFVVFLDNGQIWRQRKSDSTVVRLSKNREYEVEVYEGAISGYRMKIPGASKILLVERLK